MPDVANRQCQKLNQSVENAKIKAASHENPFRDLFAIRMKVPSTERRKLNQFSLTTCPLPPVLFAVQSS